MNSNKLWTKDFTIITLGSAISMLGNSLANFAISLFVLDYTKKPIFFALYMFLFTLPQIAAPVLAGPLMDRFSRRKTIYMLDFLSSTLFLLMGITIYLHIFNFTLLAVMTFVIGTISSIYMVAFDSFYPMLITEGYYSKAYSVSSSLETLSSVMIPVATFCYKSVGIFPLLMVNAASFLIAALCEMNISNIETSSDAIDLNAYSLQTYLSDSKEGFQYLRRETGLLFIAIYFTFSALTGGASMVITLPWFRETYVNGEYIYMSVWVFMIIGRVSGGMIHYKTRMAAERKYAIALMVYVSLNIFEGIYMYTPLLVMRILCFIVGILGITSYNIRISATQSYVPDEQKGRFNGAFITMTTCGSLAGEILAGLIMSYIPMRIALSIFMGIGTLSAIIFIGGNKKHIAPIYNQNV